MSPVMETQPAAGISPSTWRWRRGARAGLRARSRRRGSRGSMSERENLLAAHAWCDRAECGGELGLRLVYGAQPYWLRRGFLELGHREIAEALVRPGAETRNLVRCKALFAAGWLDYYMGRYGSAQQHLEEDLSIAREIGDEAMIAKVLQPLGMASLGQADLRQGPAIPGGGAASCAESMGTSARSRPRSTPWRS